MIIRTVLLATLAAIAVALTFPMNAEAGPSKRWTKAHVRGAIAVSNHTHNAEYRTHGQAINRLRNEARTVSELVLKLEERINIIEQAATKLSSVENRLNRLTASGCPTGGYAVGFSSGKVQCEFLPIIEEEPIYMVSLRTIIHAVGSYTIQKFTKLCGEGAIALGGRHSYQGYYPNDRTQYLIHFEGLFPAFQPYAQAPKVNPGVPVGYGVEVRLNSGQPSIPLKIDVFCQRNEELYYL